MRLKVISCLFLAAMCLMPSGCFLTPAPKKPDPKPPGADTTGTDKKIEEKRTKEQQLYDEKIKGLEDNSREASVHVSAGDIAMMGSPVQNQNLKIAHEEFLAAKKKLLVPTPEQLQKEIEWMQTQLDEKTANEAEVRKHFDELTKEDAKKDARMAEIDKQLQETKKSYEELLVTREQERIRSELKYKEDIKAVKDQAKADVDAAKDAANKARLDKLFAQLSSIGSLFMVVGVLVSIFSLLMKPPNRLGLTAGAFSILAGGGFIAAALLISHWFFIYICYGALACGVAGAGFLIWYIFDHAREHNAIKDIAKNATGAIQEIKDESAKEVAIAEKVKANPDAEVKNFYEEKMKPKLNEWFKDRPDLIMKLDKWLADRDLR